MTENRPIGTNFGYDIVLLLGQSNMQGDSGGAVSPVLDVTDSRIYTFGATGAYAGQIVPASDPLAHRSTGTTVVGPGMSFAHWHNGVDGGWSVDTRRHRRLLLVPAAYNGTAFGSGSPRWDPTTSWPADTANLYNLAILQAQAALAAAPEISRIIGALWIQGESDVLAGMSANTYRTYLEQLIDGLRSRLSAPDLPFVIGSMTPEFIAAQGSAAAAIDGVHKETPSRKPYTAYVAGPSGMGRGDNVHYSPAGQREMGRLLAHALISASENFSPTNQQAANPPTPPSAPSAPTGVTATAGVASASVAFTASGGTSFTVTASTGQTATGASSPITVPGLTGGVAVTFTVTATNLIATSAASSPSASVTPTGITENFNQADESISTADGGQTLTSLGGPWRVVSNQGAPASGTSAHTLLLGDTGATNHSAQAVIVSNVNGSGVVVRAVDINNFYVMAALSSGYALYKMVGGSLTVVQNTTGTVVAGDTIKLAVAGSTITAYKNGVQIFQVTDSALSSGTKAGLWANLATARLDDMLLA